MKAVNSLEMPVSRPHLLGMIICGILFGAAPLSYAEEIEFNTDILDVNDKKNIDLSQFSRGGFILPGEYDMKVYVNKLELPEQTISFVAPENDPKGSEACISPELAKQLGFKDEIFAKLKWIHDGQCLDISALAGMETRGDLGTSALYISIPQAYLEYASENWDPPSRWDNGIPGILLDYNVGVQAQKQQRGDQSVDVSGNGTVGANAGAWRLRADWQTRSEKEPGATMPSRQRFDWSRYYAYRAIPRLGAKISLGENYLVSDIFDSFRFAGASLMSDESQLPPNLRGYAPEVVGIARTNARVVISQQGRVLQETQVAVGPFRIQDISNAVSGQLDVRVEEQDGSVQNFTVDTASIPYLTRPGSMRYKLAAGKPSDYEHHLTGPNFATGEVSWGVNNGWSLYGGGVMGGDYNAAAIGLGRDLLKLGALSFDMTQSRATLPNQPKTLSGGSYRLSYSKNFEQYDSQITFAGYRFSERDYMSMSEYLSALESGNRNNTGNSKELYTITFNKQFRDLRLSSYVNYSHQTFWNRPDNDRYSINFSRYFDAGKFKNISLSLSAYRNIYYGTTDDGMYLSLSLPWGNSGYASYSGSVAKNNTTNRVGYYDRLNERDTYQIGAGVSNSGGTTNGSFSHRGDLAQLDANASYQAGRYSAAGVNFQGGATVTLEGAALHRSNGIGGTRLLVDTDGVADVSVKASSTASRTNHFGKAVITDVNSYYRSNAVIDINDMPRNAEATRSVVQATLTEGAIGYRKFAVIAGEKAMAVLRLADGSYPPFGAVVKNHKQQSVGIVNDEGNVYLSGILPGEKMTVNWGEKQQCTIELPASFKPSDEFANLLLPCLTVNQD